MNSEIEAGLELWEEDNVLLHELTENLHGTFAQVAHEAGTRYLLIDEEAKTEDQINAKNALIEVTQKYDNERREMHVRSRKYDLVFHRMTLERQERTDSAIENQSKTFEDIKDLLIEIRDKL